MSEALSNVLPPPGETPGSDPSLSRVLVDGLPAMAGIVTVITQPFAQESLRATLHLPDWLPFLIAIVVSGLLATHRMVLVRRSTGRECAICIPLLMLVVFSMYATGNNVVYYAKEGFTRAGNPPTGEDLGALKQELNVVRQQLQSAQEVIDVLRQALNLPQKSEAPPSSALRSMLGRLLGPAPGVAYAQEPRKPPTPPKSPAPVSLQDLNEKLRQYEERQRALDKKLDEIKRQQGLGAAQQQPLIKSW